MPVVEMVPASPVHPEGGVTVQIQLGAVPLLMDAVNCCDPPIVTVGEFGLTARVTAAEVEVGAGEAFPPPPPQKQHLQYRNFDLRRILSGAGGIARTLSKTVC